MASGPSRWRHLGAISFMLVLFLVPLAVYIFSVLEPQRRHMLQRNVRVLAETGQELEGQIRRLSPLIQFSVVPEGTTSDPELVRARVDAAEKAARTAPARTKARAEEELDRAKRVETYLVGLRKTREYRSIEIEAKGRCTHGPGAKTEHRLEGASQPLKLVSVGCRPPLPEEGGKEGVKVTITVPLADLAAPLDKAARSAFDQLIIAQEDGRLLYSSSGGPIVTADRLDHVLRSAEESGSVARIKQLSSGSGSEGDAAKLAAAEASLVLAAARRSPLEVEIDGAWYRVFAQPLTEKAKRAGTEKEAKEEASEPGTWYVLGIVSDARFRSSSLASSRSQLTLAISGVVLLLLAWPWLRLLFSGARDRVSVRHVLELIASMALGVGLLTLIVGEAVSGAALQRRLDATARDVARRIEGSFRAEIAESLTALRNAREGICKSAAAAKAGEGKFAAQLEWPSGAEGVHAYPPYDVAFVVDESGAQVGDQANYRAGEVSLIRVGPREYFTRVRDGRVWNLRGEDGSVEPFVLQRIKTYDHGWRLTAVAAPIAKGDIIGTDCEEEGAIVAALTRRFDSLTDTVLPPELGFAVVVDETGDAVFHSTDSRSLVESFLAETGSQELATLIRMRRDETAEGRYRAEGTHRFTVQPLRDLPWTLVVFQRSNLFDLLRFEMLLAAGSHLALYVTVLLSMGMLAAAVSPGRRGSWFWPDPRLWQRYARSAVFVAIVVLFELLATLWLSGPDLLWPIVTQPLAALGSVYQLAHTGDAPRRGRRIANVAVGAGAFGAVVIVLRVSSQGWLPALAMLGVAILAAWAVVWSRAAVESIPQRPRLGWHTYATLLFALLMAVIVAPSLALLEDVQRAQLDRLTRYGERTAVQAAIDRHEGLRLDAARLDPESFGDRGTASVAWSESARCRGVYLQPSLLVSEAVGPGAGATGICGAVERTELTCDGERAPDYADAFSAWLTRLLPAYAESTVAMRQIFDGGSGDRSECWLPAASGGIEYRHSGFRMIAEKLGFPGPETAGEWTRAVVGAAVIAGVSLLLIWLFGRRVLGVGIPDSIGVDTLADDPEQLLLRNRLVLFPPPGFAAGLARAARAAGWSVESVDATSDPETWGNPAPGPKPLLVVDDLHLTLTRTDARKKALSALTRIARGETIRLVVCSDVSPLDFLRTSTSLEDACTASEAGEKSEASEESVRRALELERLGWAPVLAGLQPIRIKWEPAAAEKISVKNADCAQLLREECDWTPWLQPVRQEIEGDQRFLDGVVDDRQLVYWVAERAEPLFRRIWALLPSEDRLALIQLAEGDLLNPRNDATIERLVRQGLVVRREGSFQMISRSFERFARRVERPERMREWERGVASGSWTLMRIPLLIALLLVLLYGLYAGRDTVDATLALIPAIAAGVPAVIRIFGTLRAATSEGSASSIG